MGPTVDERSDFNHFRAAGNSVNREQAFGLMLGGSKSTWVVQSASECAAASAPRSGAGRSGVRALKASAQIDGGNGARCAMARITCQ